ncbi:MAG: hypothetical protein ABGX26_02770 [Nautiliaceae bacterium]
MIKEFAPLFILRYSATHKNLYNQVYKLDAIDAFNKKLVKKISVKGIEIKNTTATTGYLYLDEIILSDKTYPRARIEFEVKQKSGVKKVLKIVKEGDNLYELSDNDEVKKYRDYDAPDTKGEYAKIFEDIEKNEFKLSDEFKDYKEDIIKLVQKIDASSVLKNVIEDEKAKNVKLEKLTPNSNFAKFEEFWQKIKFKTSYRETYPKFYVCDIIAKNFGYVSK